MAPKCPKCSTALQDDYGMVNCPSCGAIVFVDMDGVAHVQSDLPEQESAPVPEVISSIEPSELPETFSLEPAASMPMSFEPLVSEPATEPATAPDAPEMDMNAFLGYSDPSAPEAAPASQNDPNDPLGLSAYANSEMSAATNGPLVVTIIISGIDAKDLRDEIRQALQDSRFGWDTAALMSGIQSGVLRIERVSPVKATVLINRIKNLSVRIRWEQNVITEIDPPEEEP